MRLWKVEKGSSVLEKGAFVLEEQETKGERMKTRGEKRKRDDTCHDTRHDTCHDKPSKLVLESKPCPICLSNFTGNLRKPLVCPFCQFETCMQCAKTYLLTCQSQPKCMKCFGAWDTVFVTTHFNAHWRRTALSRHLDQFLLEEQIALLPLEMPLFAAYQAKQKSQKEYLECEAQLKKLMTQYPSGSQSTRSRCALEEAETRLFVARNEAERDMRQWLNVSRREQKMHRETRPCPTPSCRGFLVDWRCGICKVHVCKDCLTLMPSQEHQCQEADIKSAALIQNETRSCPGCKIRVFRIDGCAQMFCVQCRTPFSWETGEVIHGPIHNPHFLTFLSRATPKEAQDWKNRYEWTIGERGEPDEKRAGLRSQEIFDIQLRAQLFSPQDTELVLQAVAACHFLLDEGYQLHDRDQKRIEKKQKQLRLEYLNKEKDKEAWTRALRRMKTRSERNQALASVSLQSGHDILRHLLGLLATREQDEWMIHLDHLKAFPCQHNVTIEQYNKSFPSARPQSLMKIDFGFHPRVTRVRRQKKC